MLKRFTPESVTRLMVQLTVDPVARPSAGQPLLINDPCCGTGRMLLEASNLNPHAELVGQDIDARCAKITAINLGLRDATDASSAATASPVKRSLPTASVPTSTRPRTGFGAA
jgi:type I restriction-modification system DNA methylase subunit